MRRLATVALLATLAALAAAGLAAAISVARAGDPTVEKRWTAAKTHVTLVLGTSDYSAGDVRVSFLVIAGDGRLLTSPRARLSVSKGLKEPAFTTGSAVLENTSPSGARLAADEAGQIFVGHIRLTAPGTYWLLAELDGKSVAGLGNVIVRAHPEAPAVGDRAPASRTPTLATTKDIGKLTTRVPPDRELLQVSIADALRRKQPFVVVFATPKFCSSRTCGPVVDVVDGVRKRWAGTAVRFIHVEIYTDNVPSKGPNKWVLEWKLPTEPWTFLVGKDGRVKARIEGSLSQGELASAIERSLGVAAPRG